MSDIIFVMLIDGRPYRKEGAIRTYKTRERADKEAQRLAKYWSYRDSKFEVGVFTVSGVRPVKTKPYEDTSIPSAPAKEEERK